MDTELLRSQFLPNQIDILLVGESPPKKGRFFYDTCAMTTFTSRPFESVFERSFSDNSEFLGFFKEQNCFLDDLSHEPVDHLDKNDREDVLKNCIVPLADRLAKWQPKVVCIVLKKIEPYVRSAIIKSGIYATVYVLPFPGNGHQNKYISELTKVIKKHSSK